MKQSEQIKAECDHLGSCLRAGKTPAQQAEMDDRFFDLLDRQQVIRREMERQRVIRK